jgi:tetratricopeptide (TPR) repeat protein
MLGMKINYLFSPMIIGLTVMMASTAVVVKPTRGEVVNGTLSRRLDALRINQYTQVISSNPDDFDAYYKQGTTQAKLSNWQGAIANYNQAIRINPKNANAYYQRGFARSELNDYQGALEDLNQAIQLNPKHSEAYHRRGFVRERLNDADGAVSDYTRAVQTVLDKVR